MAELAYKDFDIKTAPDERTEMNTLSVRPARWKNTVIHGVADECEVLRISSAWV